MNADEVNVVRYIAGYIVRSLIRKYEKNLMSEVCCLWNA